MARLRTARLFLGLVGAILAEAVFLVSLGGILVLWALPAVLFGLATTRLGVADSHVLAALVPVLAVLPLLQLYYARRQAFRSVSAPGTGSFDETDRVTVRCRRLAQQADVAVPDVNVASGSVPASFTIGVRDPQIVITEGLLSKLDDEAELDAVLAHEIGHIANRDVALTTVVAAVPIAIAGLVQSLQAPLARVLSASSTYTEATHRQQEWYLFFASISILMGLIPVALFLFVPIGFALVSIGNRFGTEGVAAGVVVVGAVLVMLLCMLLVLIPVGLPLLVLSSMIGSVPASYVSRTREFAADEAAARLTGDPATLATVLRRLDAETTTVPSQDARVLHSLQHLCLVPFERDGPDDPSPLVRSHPPTAERIARLEEITVAQASGTASSF